MKISLIYYSGTGNSLWIAKKVAELLPGSELHSMDPANIQELIRNSDATGWFFPVHMWGLPRRVTECVRRLDPEKNSYHFAFASNGGQVVSSLKQLGRLLKQRRQTLSCGFSIRMPSNYIPFGGAISREKQEKLFREADEKIRSASEEIRQQKTLPLELGSLGQRMFLPLLYRLVLPLVPGMDKQFWVDKRCDGCRTCVRVCPAQNIVLEDRRPRFLHRCEQCLACVQWCPRTAIQIGKKTPFYERYHHPEINLSEMIRDRK